ncbi:MAG: AAA family ATPase [Chloroflexota bacterium]
MIPNPFFHGNPVSPPRWVDRQRELRRLVGRIVSQGQSTAVVGDPRSGKTSLLMYLADREMRVRLYGLAAPHLVFTFMDAQTFTGQFSQAQFWEVALRPLYEQVVAPNPGSPLAQAYQVCQQNAFGAFVLERLLTQIAATDWRVVLLLDEFDALLHHPILNSAEFFGSLRSLVSRSRGALALVLAGRQSLADLNKTTQDFSRTGSPYFNFLDELVLGPFAEKAITELLNKAGDRFTADDRQFITSAAGGHPYLLQAAASALWDAGEVEPDSTQRRRLAGEEVARQAATVIDRTWALWSPATRRAFALVGLAQVPHLLGQRAFDMKRLLQELPDLGPELRMLEKQGYLTQDATLPAGWRVRPLAFLWWLMDELVRLVREEKPLEVWLREQEFDGLLKRGEKEQLGRAVRAAGGLLKEGATTLIKAAAEATGKGMTN